MSSKGRRPKQKIFFICDRNKCGLNCNSKCMHTQDINHAIRPEGEFKKDDFTGDMWQIACSVDGEIIHDSTRLKKS